MSKWSNCFSDLCVPNSGYLTEFHLVKLKLPVPYGPSADFYQSVNPDSSLNAGASTLVNGEVPTHKGGDSNGRSASGLVFADMVFGAEHAGSNDACRFVDPGICIIHSRAVRIRVECIHFIWSIQELEAEIGSPLRPSGDPDGFLVIAHDDVAGFFRKRRNRPLSVCEPPGGAHAWVSGKRQFTGRGEDLNSGSCRHDIVNEDCFAEAELSGYLLLTAVGSSR